MIDVVNTKKLDRTKRKAAKRKARRATKSVLIEMTREEWVAMKKAKADLKTWKGLKPWLENHRNPPKKEKAEDKPAEAASPASDSAKDATAGETATS